MANSETASSRMARLRAHYSHIKESERVEYIFEVCNKYAWPMVVVNLVLYGLLTTPVFAVLFIGGILIHEGGHYAAQRYYGFKPDLYMFPLLGAGVGEPYRDNEDAELSDVGKRDVYLAGPAASLSVSALAGFGYVAFGHYELLAFALVFALNDIFNLLPVWKVDGGRANKARRRLRTDNPMEAIATSVAHGALVVANGVLIAFLFLTQRISVEVFIDGIAV